MSEPAHLQVGRWAEDQALAYLCGQGLRPLARNFRCRRGELDLVMADAGVLVFVEVRYRASQRYGAGYETITAPKRRKLVAAARVFLARQGDAAPPPCRFDVVSVTKRNYAPHIQWIKDAFTQDG